MTPGRRTALLRTIFWIAIVLSFLAAINPLPPLLPGAPSDKVQHIFAFLVLGALAIIAYRDSGPLRLLIGLSAFGALIEVVQTIPALHRDGDVMDWIADTVAAAAILAILHAARRPSAGTTGCNG